MSEQITRCPGCQVTFNVSESQLNAANGLVRCGTCLETFNGLDYLTKSPSPTKPWKTTKVIDENDFLIDDNFDVNRLFAQDPDPDEPLLIDDDFDLNKLHLIAETEDYSADRTTSEAIKPLSPEQPARHPDVFEASQHCQQVESSQSEDFPPPLPNKNSQRYIHWFMYASTVLALVALPWLYMHTNASQLAKHGYFNNTLAAFCRISGCPVPLQTDKSLILSTNLSVRSHPVKPGILLIDATLINKADFPQPFPKLTFQLEDLQGKQMSQRVFSPSDYLQGRLGPNDLMPIKKAIKFQMEIADPGNQAVSFSLYSVK